MDAITVSAKFVAYNWFSEIASGKYDSQSEATRFAEENWKHFLANADKGLGRLLIRLSRTRPTKRGSRKQEEAA